MNLLLNEHLLNESPPTARPFCQLYRKLLFVSFIGNFGGLLGMWLGISVMEIFDDIYKLSNKLIMMMAKSHEKKNKLFIQSNINFINLSNFNSN